MATTGVNALWNRRSAEVAAITRQDLVDWHGKYVHPNNIILGIVGDFFFLSPTGVGFRAASTGDPNLNRPFFNLLLNRPDAELVSFPGVLNGGVLQLETEAPRFH